MNIEQFTKYFEGKMKSNLTLKQRLKSISEYFSEKENKQIDFDNKTEAYTHIITYTSEKEDEAENILEELFYILEYTYSAQNPYFVYDIKTNQDVNTVHLTLGRLFRNEIRAEDFYYNRRKNISFDRIKKLIEIDLDYREIGMDVVSDNEFVKNTGIIKLTFDLVNNKVISSVSINGKNHNNLLKYLQSNGFTITPSYILKRALTIKNRNFSEFSPTTLLIIILLYKTIPDMGYSFTLESISFSNLDSQNVQGMKMKGTDLLKAPEVLQRIHFGDDVHTIKLSLEIIKEINGVEKYFNSTFIVELRGKLAFIFFEDNMNESAKREISIKLQNSLMELIYADDTIKLGQQIIHDHLPKPKSFNKVVSEIKEELLQLVDNQEVKEKVESYFSEKFPFSSM